MSVPGIETKMRSEVEDIPHAVQRLLDKSLPEIKNAADAARALDPRIVCTVARGSSDHAATYLKYAIELNVGIPVASIGPSVSSIYGAQLNMERGVCVGISQSGQSPDITSMIKSAGAGGALTIAITNDSLSPLADASAHVLNIQAQLEKSVAATKTFVTSIVSGLLLLAHWTRNEDLLTSLHELPELSAKAISCNWQCLADRMKDDGSLYVLGRGPSFAIANEVALKFKETCQIQAEAFSSAEVLHGPVSIVGKNFPVLALISRDKSESSVAGVAHDLALQGADVFATSQNLEAVRNLPVVSTGNPLTDPLMLVVSFYAFIEELARMRGLNPDEPRNLNKVTETV